MKKSRKANPFAVGDVFSIPIDDGQKAFARIINIKDGWNLAEIFMHTSKSFEEWQTNGAVTTLYPPFHFDIRDVESGALPIVGNLASSTDSYLPKLRFCRGLPGRREVIRVNQYTPDGIVPEAEAKQLPVQKFHALPGMIEAAKKILATGMTTQEWLDARSD